MSCRQRYWSVTNYTWLLDGDRVEFKCIIAKRLLVKDKQREPVPVSLEPCIFFPSYNYSICRYIIYRDFLGEGYQTTMQ